MVDHCEAGRILHLSERQVNRYGLDENPRLTTNRAGRRVLYLASDVYNLADELRGNIKRAPQRTALMPREPVCHLQEQAEMMRQSGATQASSVQHRREKTQYSLYDVDPARRQRGDRRIP